jgi:hypothetical protein
VTPEELLASVWAHVWAFVIGVIFASHANVWIARIPVGMSVFRRPGKSFCMACKTPIRWFDQVPIASYLILGGRCRACGGRFSVRYPLVELSGGLVAVALWHLFMVLLHPEQSPARRMVRFAVNLLGVLLLEGVAVIALERRRARRMNAERGSGDQPDRGDQVSVPSLKAARVELASLLLVAAVVVLAMILVSG